MSHRLTQQEFLDRCYAAHGTEYDLSRVRYTGVHNLIEVVCAKHGEFFPTASHFAKGSRCKKCANMHTEFDYLGIVGRVHQDKYILDSVVYKGNREKVSPTCRTHGLFWIRGDAFARGSGCRQCSFALPKTKPRRSGVS